METNISYANLKASYTIYVDAFGEAQVSFSLPAPDWLKLERSEAMRGLDEYLVEVQKTGMMTFPPNQPIVVERVVYKNSLVEALRFLCGKMIALCSGLCRRGKICCR